MGIDLSHKKQMDEFGEDNLPSLSTTVLGALELFADRGLPDVKIPDYKKPIIVGSGNAIVTARLLYGDSDAFFADENNYREALERENDGAIIFSASGEKHATVVAKEYTAKNVPVTLVTCNPNSTAGEIVGAENTVVTDKNREPYTYNTSTYMGWVFAKTRENPEEIWRFIQEKVQPVLDQKMAGYDGYLLVTPEFFAQGNRLFEVKFIELFARRVARDVRTYEELKHAITVVPYEKELCIQFGEGEVEFGSDKMRIPLPENVGLAAMMAIGYFVIGKIQEGKPNWFQDYIGEYIARVSAKPFGKGLKVIVD